MPGRQTSSFNIGFFIDELKRLGSEVVLESYQRFVKHVRNMEESWVPLGFVENQSNFKDQKGYVKEKKMNSYHAMIAHIFREFRSIIENRGIKVDLDYGTGVVHKDIIIVPVIQYIIGDCKGNNVHCGRKGTHVLTTPRLCRDCNIPLSEADNVNYRCNMASMRDFLNKTKVEMDAMSHYNINNAWYVLPFGGCPHNIHCSCPESRYSDMKRLSHTTFFLLNNKDSITINQLSQHPTQSVGFCFHTLSSPKIDNFSTQ